MEKYHRTGPFGEELYNLVNDGKAAGYTEMQIARQLNMSHMNMMGRLRAYKSKVDGDVYPFKFDFGQPWELKGDFMIVGDVHVPFTDTEFAMLPALIAKKHLKPPLKLIIAGDFINMDNFSSFAEIVQLPDWQQERLGAKMMVDSWMETFSQIWMLMGNHERRLQRFTLGAFNEQDILRLIEAPVKKVKMSGFGYCTLKTPRGDWRITHPKNYNQREGSVVNKLAQKYRQNIIGFHEHHSGLAIDDSGQNVIVNVGTLADPDKFPYVRLEDSTKPTMKKSFLMMRGGYPYLFSNELTDWDFWL